jgi:hypothetical protein
VPEVAASGEWSLVFLGSAFSHAVCKRPRDGDFRVQPLLGGTATPPGQRSLYARVDGIERDGRLMVMELECIEPQLHLRSHPGAVERLAEAVSRALV